MFSLLSRKRLNRRAAVFLCALLAVGFLTAGVLPVGGTFGALGDDTATQPASALSEDEHSMEETNSSTERLIVRFEPLTEEDGAQSPAAFEAHANATQEAFVMKYDDEPAVEIVEQFWVANAILADVQTDRVSPTTLEDQPGVVRVHENFEVTPAAGTGTQVSSGDREIPSTLSAQNRTRTGDADLLTASTQYTYGLEMVRAPEVWEQFDTRGEGATVAVLDTGIDPQRADLTVEDWAEFDTSGERVNSKPHDSHGHGTHVAGTVLGDDASGMAIGVAPGAALYGVKVTDDDGSGTFAQILAGMQWATTNDDVDIIQMSLGASGRVQAYHEPVTNAKRIGTLVVAASGNDGQGTSSSPANIYESLSVGAVGASGQVPPFSSGQTLDTTADWNWSSSPPANWPETYVVPSVAAPGVQIPSAAAGYRTELQRSSGTSMAAPHVSGVGALMLAATDGEITPEEIADAVQETSAHPHGNEEPDDRYGHGIVDGFAAVEEVTNRSTAAATFEVEIVGTNSPVTTGELLEIETEITNNGTAEGTQQIALDIDGIGPIDTENVTLAPGETTTANLQWQTTATTYGEFTATVASENDADSQTVIVDALNPAQFELESVDYDANVTAGDEFNVTVTVRNTGDVEGNQEVSLAVDDSTVDAITLLLDANESMTVTLSWPTDEADVGERTFTVTSFDDERTHTVTVEPRESDDGSSEPPERTDDSDQSGSGFVAVVVVAIIASVAFAFFRWRRTK